MSPSELERQRYNSHANFRNSRRRPSSQLGSSNASNQPPSQSRYSGGAVAASKMISEFAMRPSMAVSMPSGLASQRSRKSAAVRSSRYTAGRYLYKYENRG